MRSRFRVKEPALLAVCGLALTTSCTPGIEVAGAARTPPTAWPSPARETDAPALLRGLALRVPADVAAAPPVLVPTADRIRATAPVAAPPFLAPAQSTGDAARATDCLTAAVYYEARSEPLDGQRAVAQVVLNRVRDRAFPASVCGVVYQHPVRGPGCQFSFACDGSMDRPRDEAAWQRAQRVATAALAGDVYAPIGAATYYHAASVLPWWAVGLARVGSIGAHIFYRWQDGLERALAFRQAYAGAEPLPAAAQAGVAVHRGLAGVAGVTLHYGVPEATAEVTGGPTDMAAVVVATDDASGRRARGGGPAREAAAAIAGVTVHLGTARLPSTIPDNPGG